MLKTEMRMFPGKKFGIDIQARNGALPRLSRHCCSPFRLLLDATVALRATTGLWSSTQNPNMHIWRKSIFEIFSHFEVKYLETDWRAKKSARARSSTWCQLSTQADNLKINSWPLCFFSLENSEKNYFSHIWTAVSRARVVAQSSGRAGFVARLSRLSCLSSLFFDPSSSFRLYKVFSYDIPIFRYKRSREVPIFRVHF